MTGTKKRPATRTQDEATRSKVTIVESDSESSTQIQTSVSNIEVRIPEEPQEPVASGSRSAPTIIARSVDPPIRAAEIDDVTGRFSTLMSTDSARKSHLYNPWDGQVELHQGALWYDARELLREISAIRRINWCKAEERAQGLERLSKVEREAPFDFDTRFPGRGQYICEANGIWPRLMQQLRSSLQCTQGSKDPKSKEATVMTYAEASDAQQSFNQATTKIMDAISLGDYVFNRRKFEAHYCVEWVEASGRE